MGTGEEKEGRDGTNSEGGGNEELGVWGLGWRVGGVIERDWLWSLSFPLPQWRFHSLFTGGGAVREAVMMQGGAGMVAA